MGNTGCCSCDSIAFGGVLPAITRLGLPVLVPADKENYPQHSVIAKRPSLACEVEFNWYFAETKGARFRLSFTAGSVCKGIVSFL